MKRREFLSKIGAVLATAATGATLAKAADFKRRPQAKPLTIETRKTNGVFFVKNGAGRVIDLRIDERFRKIAYKVQFKDGHVEHRAAYEKFGKYVIDPFDHRVFKRR